MKNIRFKIVLLLGFLSFFILEKIQAQEKKVLSELKLKEVKGLGKNALRLGDTYTALYYYKEWSERKPEKLDVTFQVAMLYKYTRNYKEAEVWFKKLSKSHAQDYPLAVYYHARMLMALEEYEKAKIDFLKFKKLLREVKDPTFRKLNKNGILSCDYALQMKDSSSIAVIKHLDTTINKPHVEFSPVLLDERTLLYGSLKVNGLDYYNISAHDSMKIPLRKFYIAKIDSAGNWKGKGLFNAPINKEDMHVGNATITKDGLKLFFTICQKNWKNEINCKLYHTIKNKNNWSEPVLMDENVNLTNTTTTQPAVGFESKRNREIVYFVSNRQGGKGGLDIWYAEYNPKKKKYKAPRNVGSKINSTGDEMTPYYDPSTRSMYFSSNGKIGYGGFDVYKTTGEKSKWTVATALGKEINTSYDDLDFTLNTEKSGGFLVSNRPGGTSLLSETCCDDLYEFKYSKFIKIDLLGEVKDSLGCLKNYDITLYLKDSVTNERFLTKKLQVDSCGFHLDLDQGYEYQIEVNKKGYFTEKIDLATTHIEASILLNKTVMMKKIPKEPIIIKGVLYEYNSDQLTESTMKVLDTTLLKLMLENTNITVTIAAHTDNKGSESYNLNLSKRRAKSVVKYLVKKGISEDRLTAEGYGESKPIYPNTNEDGTDNPEGRALNRRTEFTITGEVNREVIFEKTTYKNGKRKKMKL